MRFLLVLVLLLLLLALQQTACAKLDYSSQTIPLTDVWGSAEPSDDALQRYTAAAAYAEQHGAVELLVIEGTHVVFEWTRADYDPTSPRHLFSGTKSFSCALADVLVADGTLDLAAPVSATIPELASGDDVTADDLLHFTSGIEQRFAALTIDGMREEQQVQDKYAYAVALPDQWDAGSRFEYGSSHQMVLGELVVRLTGQDALQVLDERVFDAIGFRYAGWHRDPAGNPMLPYGAWTTAHEWAKFGVLLRDDGLWQGGRVLPEGVRDRCTEGSQANPAYGRTFWLNAPLADDARLGGISQIKADGRPILDPDGHPDLFAAAGHKEQRLYIAPAEDLVVVLLSDGGRGFEDRALLELLLSE